MTDPDPYAIRLWLPVRLPSGAADTLYTKTIRTAHTPPEVSDSPCITLWAEDDSAGIAEGKWFTDEGRWDVDGTYNLDLVPLWPDPDPNARATVRNLRSTGFPWTRGGGPDHHTLLRAAGWTEWDGQP